jgi:aryl-alcohol dehydrogenase-like predicted oxidoreductase
MASFALRFVTSNPTVSCAIPGARNRHQPESNVAAGHRPALTPEEQAGFNAIVTPGGGRKIWPEVT